MIRIRDDIYWTGYIDWDLRNFHGYSTHFGSTYNAYFILDESPTLIDTVKSCGCDEMLSRIKEFIDPSKIKYIISNHAEMDHSGSIAKLLELCPEAEVICSPKGKEALKKYFKNDWNFKVVNTGDVLNIGKRKLKFILTPMIHWPDSMATYLESEGILFSNDAFGQHYASYGRFVEEADSDDIFKEAKKYYANIIMPYGSQVQSLLDVLVKFKIETICPSHGLIWRNRQNVETIMDLYGKWAGYVSERKVVIIYDTMWKSTEKIAKKLYELIYKEEIPVKVMNLEVSDISDVVTEIMDSSIVFLGSPMLNNNMLPKVGGLISYLKGLKPKNRQGLTFGSYGWSKAGFKELENSLNDMGIKLLGEGKYFQFIPDEKELDSLKDVVSQIKKILV